jgi:hypothetical protein
MSWDQNYDIPTYDMLIERLTGKTSTRLLEEELERQGLIVKEVEQVLLAEGYVQDAGGLKVTFSDGRVYIPKLIERHTADGNWGKDVYDWCLIGDEPEVMDIDDSQPIATPEELAAAEDDLYPTDESEPASDGEPCTCNGVDHCHCDSDRFCTPECTRKIGYNPDIVDEIDEPDLRDESY